MSVSSQTNPMRPGPHRDHDLTHTYEPPLPDTVISDAQLLCCGIPRRGEGPFNMFARTTHVATCVTSLVILGSIAGVTAWAVLTKQHD